MSERGKEEITKDTGWIGGNCKKCHICGKYLAKGDRCLHTEQEVRESKFKCTP